jgi:hypothetical protein
VVFGDFWHLSFKQCGQKATQPAFSSVHQARRLNIFLTPLLRVIIHHFGARKWLWMLGEKRDGTSSAKSNLN